MKYLSMALIGITLLACSSCSWFSNELEEKPAQTLIQDGIDAFEEGRYSSAIKNFEQLKDWYPFSKYAILAELKIADAHYHLKQYPEAITAYEEFEQLHPRNEATPYVIYQIGECYYEQIDTIDRDQTSAQKALAVYQRLIQQHPQDPYAEQAKLHTIKCLQSLAGHDFYVGEYYFKSKQYKAALQRFLTVVTKYPDMGIHHKALLYITTCETLIANTPEPGT
jgi:outer membrane protein assembly factor BamD